MRHRPAEVGLTLEVSLGRDLDLQRRQNCGNRSLLDARINLQRRAAALQPYESLGIDLLVIELRHSFSQDYPGPRDLGVSLQACAFDSPDCEILGFERSDDGRVFHPPLEAGRKIRAPS